jgi:hypothetical protein
MQRDQLADLGAVAAMTEERSFTRAAAKLGITQSSLSHTLRLESRSGASLIGAYDPEHCTDSGRRETARHASSRLRADQCRTRFPKRAAREARGLDPDYERGRRRGDDPYAGRESAHRGAGQPIQAFHRFSFSYASFRRCVCWSGMVAQNCAP